MIPALLLAAAVIAPGQQSATVPTGAFPPVSVGTNFPSCGVVVLEVRAPVGVVLAGGGDIGNQPPWRGRGMDADPTRITVARDPGTSVRWAIVYDGTTTKAAEGITPVPPCISAPPVPVEIIDSRRIEAAPPRRVAVFREWAQRIGRAW